MEERRREPRLRTLKSARIVFNNRYSAMDCAVRNLSQHGAMLLIDGPQGVPNSFRLELRDGTTAHDCRVIWRDAKRVGVEFVG